ncbi:MAG: NAD(P)H-dependent oxidoreductase [Thermoleophilia bacterium]
MRAVALNCTLKASPAPSSCELLLTQVLGELRSLGVDGEIHRVADLHVPPGVESDLGDGDEWPRLRRAVVEADILVLGTPIWMGQPSSVCKRVLERMDAFLGETDDAGRTPAYGKVAVVAVVGNEDGAHHTSAELFQALNDVGFTIPAAGVTYWVGEAMGRTDFRDLPETPQTTAGTTRTAAVNAVHLAALLGREGYPPA